MKGPTGEGRYARAWGEEDERDKLVEAMKGSVQGDDWRGERKGMASTTTSSF